MLFTIKSTLMAILLAIFTITTASTNATETGFLYLPGPNGSSLTAVGDGLDTIEEGWRFTLGSKSYPNANAMSFGIYFETPGDTDYWYLSIQMPFDERIKPGIYEATRFPFNTPSNAGFSWSGNGVGLNTLEAVFEVYEVRYNNDFTQINKIAFDFIQVETQFGEPADLDIHKWAYGSYRLNSDIPLGVPEPGSALLALVGGSVVALRRRRR